MATVQVATDSGAVTVALKGFALNIERRETLLRSIGLGQLKSVRLTFRESGVPANSWMPLAPSTKKKYKSEGHKLLIKTGRLLNSISFAVAGNSVLIGTNVVYAAVHQFGSRDRGSVGYAPRTKEQHEALTAVGKHSRSTSTAPRGGRFARVRVWDKNGRARTIRTRRPGPSERGSVVVSGHNRHQNIPARPYLVFRPEDPARIERTVQAFVAASAKQAGLQVQGGN